MNTKNTTNSDGPKVQVYYVFKNTQSINIIICDTNLPSSRTDFRQSIHSQAWLLHKGR